MATFPAIAASYGIQKSSQPKVRTVQFGDGYTQRLRYSYLNDPKVWSVSFNNLLEADSDTVETFLQARASDGDSFDWTPPGEASALKFFCYEWNKTIDVPNRATIQATFTQVFET
jgi:phage-related protein